MKELKVLLYKLIVDVNALVITQVKFLLSALYFESDVMFIDFVTFTV